MICLWDSLATVDTTPRANDPAALAVLAACRRQARRQARRLRLRALLARFVH